MECILLYYRRIRRTNTTKPRILEGVRFIPTHAPTPEPRPVPAPGGHPGVHSKFIEGHRSVLTELFDLVLPDETVDKEAGGVSGFCRRYGFVDNKPVRVRFRILDDALAVFPTGTDQNIAVTHDTFAGLAGCATGVFFTGATSTPTGSPSSISCAVYFRKCGLSSWTVTPSRPTGASGNVSRARKSGSCRGWIPRSKRYMMISGTIG